MTTISENIENPPQGYAVVPSGAGNPFHEIAWEAEQDAFASADDLLALALGLEPVSLRTSFQRRFTQMQRFQMPVTTFTPMMLYGLYVLAARSGAAAVAVCGVDSGPAAAALASGAADGSGDAAMLRGSERDENLAGLARKNLALLELPRPPEVMIGAAMGFLTGFPPGSAGIVFLDSWQEDHPALLPAAMDILAPGGLLLIHDPLLKRCQPDMERVTSLAEASDQFDVTLTLPLDELGLWLARRKEDQP